MKKIQIGGHVKGSEIKGYALVDDDDFLYLKDFKWGLDKDGYAIRQYGTHKKVKRMLMSREIMKPGRNMDIDHKDRNRLNNTRENLRMCTRSKNNMNAVVRKKSKSGYKGVYFRNDIQKFEAYIGLDKKHVWIGYYNTKEEAAIAYNNAALIHFGEFARPNIIK